ncbi:uncharacterized protein YALI1_A00574g [Yarrowia lipolytica]|uniref:Uncharacterized protein n=1 Tax=Yarrowia lipolytica TaxID=4952 RepID=A0A1D8N378_YARLL|nr:hypothetical protein YALI1_A00574g [Yarrowia lipolytica]
MRSGKCIQHVIIRLSNRTERLNCTCSHGDQLVVSGYLRLRSSIKDARYFRLSNHILSSSQQVHRHSQSMSWTVLRSTSMLVNKINLYTWGKRGCGLLRRDHHFLPICFWTQSLNLANSCWHMSLDTV